MPRYNIWIREADNDKWLAVKDKPQFLSDALNGSYDPIRDGDPLWQIDPSNITVKEMWNSTEHVVDDPTYTDPEESA